MSRFRLATYRENNLHAIKPKIRYRAHLYSTNTAHSTPDSIWNRHENATLERDKPQIIAYVKR